DHLTAPRSRALCARLRAAALRAVRTLVAARAPARSSIILQLLARGLVRAPSRCGLASRPHSGGGARARSLLDHLTAPRSRALCARLRAAALRAVRTLVAARAPARSSIMPWLSTRSAPAPEGRRRSAL